MKNVKAFVFLLLAIATGLAAAFYAASWMAQRANVAANKIIVAAMDIDPGSKLNPEMLSTVDWPSNALPPGALQDIKQMQDRVVKVGLVRGEAILEGKLAPVGTRGGLSAVIADGKRAMTVRVNDVVGVAGFALPGTYVDVMVNAQQDHDGRSSDGKHISKTVLENVLVLAVAQEASRDDTKPKVVSAVTLELSLEDSEKLDLARSVGTLSLVLRNQIDKKTVATGGITKGELFGVVKAPVEKIVAEAKPAAARPARPKPARSGPCVEVIHMQDGSKSLSCFQ
ncbi:Flp pilus assembly protein CpaB [Noviherbaspirillum galbum]|uniref:Flp pilus assembly protein CpaB n=1 Tax=Noviherbaspirillum galbum TaxID=2709383 RepID=A0A6B3STS9_9BURK|nr:Flp pilus assembly protein CpaB [Noviherbaspirillum galbum]NEX61039.1 Flp pilus assembly protein CpaB [Noviherbaspirillum galbum]